MADSGVIPFGQAPWEQGQAVAPSGAPASGVIPFGQAPWEQGAQPPSNYQGAIPTWLNNHPNTRALVQGTLNLLPTVGMVGGGIAGAELGPGAVATAAAGGAGGEALKNIGDQYILGQTPQTTGQYLGDVAKSGVESGLAEMGGQAAGAAIKAAADTPIGQATVKTVGNIASKLGNTTSGIPQQVLKTYANNMDEVNNMARVAGNDEAELADQFRSKTNSAIQSTKAQLNNQISQTLQSRAGQTVDSQPIIDALNSAKNKINAKLNPEQIDQIDDLISKVKAVTNETGKIPLQDAHDLTQYLQGQASPSYGPNGTVFSLGDKAAQAAKSGAAVSRSLVNTAAPEIQSANADLAELHNIDDTMNSNMLQGGKPGASIFSAGSGNNPAGAKILKRIGTLTGTDVLGDAQKAAAARIFGNPDILPIDMTGKSWTRMALDAGVGALGSHMLGGGLEGAGLGGFAADVALGPMGTKGMMRAGKGLADFGTDVAQGAPSLAGAATVPTIPGAQIPNVPLAPAAQSQPLPIRTPQIQKNQMPANTPQGQPTQKPQSTPQTTPAPQKGPQKWAQDGMQNLIQHVGPQDAPQLQALQSKIMNDPKGRALLFAASDLKPGTKAMANILSQIKAKYGGNE